jgi:hypothetical protein
MSHFKTTINKLNLLTVKFMLCLLFAEKSKLVTQKIAGCQL